MLLSCVNEEKLSLMCLQVFTRKKHPLDKDCMDFLCRDIRQKAPRTDSMCLSSGSHLSSLECLDLSNNNLSVVPKGMPRNLVLLHLEKNSINSIPGDALASVRNLEYLLLHNNKLRSRSIHPTAFQVQVYEM